MVLENQLAAVLHTAHGTGQSGYLYSRHLVAEQADLCDIKVGLQREFQASESYTEITQYGGKK